MWNMRRSASGESHEACSENEWKIANDLAWTLKTYRQILKFISSCFDRNL